LTNKHVYIGTGAGVVPAGPNISKFNNGTITVPSVSDLVMVQDSASKALKVTTVSNLVGASSTDEKVKASATGTPGYLTDTIGLKDATTSDALTLDAASNPSKVQFQLKPATAATFGVVKSGANVTNTGGVLSVADANTSGTKGVASYDNTDFDVTAGVVSIKDSVFLNKTLSGGAHTVGQVVKYSSGFTYDDLSLVPKSYVDAKFVDQSSLFDWKNSVKTLAVANVTLSGTQTINGVSLVAGDRILLTEQTAGNENGIWVVAAGSWTRAADFDIPNFVGDKLQFIGSVVYVDAGTYLGTRWVCNNVITASNVNTWTVAADLETTVEATAPISVLTAIAGGVTEHTVSLRLAGTGGLSVVSSDLSIKLDGVSLGLSANGLKVLAIDGGSY
jgi:hypothetical protein